MESFFIKLWVTSNMNLILNSLIPLAIIITLGFIAGGHNIIEAKSSKYFASYIMSFSFPCLLFAITATAKLSDLINYKFMLGLMVGLMGMYLVILGLNHYIYRRSIKESCQNAFVCSFPDMAFMGIPIFLVLFGTNSLISIAIGNIITSVIMIPLTVSILEASQQEKTNMLHLILKVFRKPLVLAPVFGFIFSALHIVLPHLIMDSLKLLGNTTSGVSLFTLGLIMAKDKICLNKHVLLNIFCKNIIHPAIMGVIVIILGITGNWAREAILLCALPSAIMTGMFALKYQVLELESSSTIIFGCVVGLVSIALIMHILGI